MKKWLAAMAIGSMMVFSAGTVYAWGGGYCGGGGPGYGMGYNAGYGHMLFLKDTAGLNDEQVEKIIKIDSDFRVKYYQNRNDADKLYSLRVEHRKAVENVLTAEQKKKLDEFSKGRDGRFYGRYYGNCPWR